MRECAGGHVSPCTSSNAGIRCGSCGAVSYCSPAHQRLHWKQHRQECERMAQQMTKGDALSDFPFTFSLQTTLSVDQDVSTLCSFFESRGLHKLGIWRIECECGYAEMSSLGSGRAHRDIHWYLPGGLAPCKDISSERCHLESWIEYYTWRKLSFDSPAAIVLHWPLTLYHVLRLTASQRQTSLPETGESLSVHYLGPERELDQLDVFCELHALLPMVQIHIDFIGPSIPASRDGEILELACYMKCSDADCECKVIETCVQEDKSQCTTDLFQHGYKIPITLKLWKGLYHDVYEELKKGTSPDLVFAPNAGLLVFPSWISSIKLISKNQVPAIFTDFCEEATVLGANFVSEALAIPVTYPVQVNPFRQPSTPPNKITELPTYSNCFIFGIN